MSVLRSIVQQIEFLLEIDPTFPYILLLLVLGGIVGVLAVAPAQYVLTISGGIFCIVGMLAIIAGQFRIGILLLALGVTLLAFGVRALDRARQQRENDEVQAAESARKISRM
jgi:membrane protein implicated in regulation of membrane protease activity